MEKKNTETMEKPWMYDQGDVHTIDIPKIK